MEAEPAKDGPPIDRIKAAAYRVPTDAPEADGTLRWDSTTIVIVHVHAGEQSGLGYTYGHRSAATVIADKFAGLLVNWDAMAPAAAWQGMFDSMRNAGQPGIGATAVSAVACALWDLKARLLGLPLTTLLGSVRQSVPIYGSGGFTSYDEDRLREQLGGWVAQGIQRVKMKVGRDPASDPDRVALAREAIGPSTELFVDANGAYSRKQALAMAEAFHVPLSAHTAPAEHMHVCCAVQPLRHIEYFHAHVRLETMLFDGVPVPNNGQLSPALSQPGMDLTFKSSDAERYRI